MKDLFGNIRFYVLLSAFGISVAYFTLAKVVFGSDRLEIIRIQQFSALTAVAFLYVTLLSGPFVYVFKRFIYRAQLMKARRALGVSAFYFATIHAAVSFFGQLGGFEGLGFLSGKYLVAISMSATALVILSLLALTSFDSVIEKIGYNRWKILQKFVYLAGVLILIHALMLGTHFQDLSGAIPQIFLSLLFILLLFESFRLDYFLSSKISFYPKIGFTTSLVIIMFGLWILIPYLSKKDTASFGIHSQHMKGNIVGIAPGNSYQKRYSVEFEHPDELSTGEEMNLAFSVTDASSGAPINDFNLLHEKKLHLIIVDEEFSTFSHLHPEQNENTFAINVTFAKDGRYRIYTDFEPKGGSEQQFAFGLRVGSDNKEIVTREDPSTEKRVDGYTVKLKNNVLKLTNMESGTATLVFDISDNSGPVTSLKPYLGAFGHLVMIHTKTFQYVHLHPLETPETLGPNGGPTVSFMPMGLYEPIIQGKYKVFAEFNPNNTLIMAPFTVTVE